MIGIARVPTSVCVPVAMLSSRADSDQVTDIDEIFVDNLPDLPYVPAFIEDMILDAVSGTGVPVETAIDAARDMNPRRWRYLHGWLNGPGGANGQVRGGRHIRYPQDTPLNNLLLNLLGKAGVEMDSFGDSTGVLSGI